MKKIKTILVIVKVLFFIYFFGYTYPIISSKTSIKSQNPPKLLIKLPTRSRADKFFKTLDIYYEKLSGNIPYHFLISCDSDDPIMNCQTSIEKLSKYPHLSFYFSEGKGKVEAVNRDIDKHLDFDILLVASDDLIPVVNHYDEIIVQKMEEHFPDFDGTLNFNDGHLKEELNTVPIIGKKFYDRFNYIYYPEYLSVCCDLELTLVSKLLDKHLYCDEVIIYHKHPAYGFSKDSLYNTNESPDLLNHDKAILQLRHGLNFDLNPKEIKSEKLPTSLALFKSNDSIPVKWSILICTLENRKDTFLRLYKKLLTQIQKNRLYNTVEVVFFRDNKEHVVGYKRNKLLENSRGQYVCFIDDDDDIHENFIKMIYEKLSQNPDCVSLTGIITWNGKNPKKIIHSIKYNNKYAFENNIYYRPPNHLNPIKRDIAIQFLFPEKNFGEDRNWCLAIAQSGLLKKEAEINEPYYLYLK